jgi:hypothetical protein
MTDTERTKIYETAQQIYDVWEEEYYLKKDFYENRALAAVLREVVIQFKYIGITEENILELANELEVL